MNILGMLITGMAVLLAIAVALLLLSWSFLLLMLLVGGMLSVPILLVQLVLFIAEKLLMAWQLFDSFVQQTGTAEFRHQAITVATATGFLLCVSLVPLIVLAVITVLLDQHLTITVRELLAGGMVLLAVVLIKAGRYLRHQQGQAQAQWLAAARLANPSVQASCFAFEKKDDEQPQNLRPAAWQVAEDEEPLTVIVKVEAQQPAIDGLTLLIIGGLFGIWLS